MQDKCPGSFLPKGARLDFGVSYLPDGSPPRREARWHGARRLDRISVGLLSGSTFTERLAVTLGYDPTAAACDAPHGTFRMLTSITERATELGGTLLISRPDGLNTELVVQIPT